MKSLLAIFLIIFVDVAFAQDAVSNKINTTLIRMESPAEDMLDEIDLKDSKKLNLLFQNIKQKMQNLNKLNTLQQGSNTPNWSLSKEIAMENSWFSLIGLEMAEMDDLPALAYTINQFSGQLVIMTKFDHLYQKNTAWMDYLGREILLLSKNENPDLIQFRKKELQKTWQQVRMVLLENKQHDNLVKKIDKLLNNIMKEGSLKKLESMAQKELDLVDEIENALQIK